MGALSVPAAGLSGVVVTPADRRAISSMADGSGSSMRCTALRMVVVSPTGSAGGRVRRVNAAVSREFTTRRAAAV